MIVISAESLPPFLPMLLVTIAAMLPRLAFYSSHSVTFLLSLPVTNHNLLVICFRLAKIYQVYKIVFKGTKPAPRKPKQDPPNVHSSGAASSHQCRGPNSTLKSRQFLIYYGAASVKSIPLCPSLIVEFIPKSHESLA
jgi:hypothetical protein